MNEIAFRCLTLVDLEPWSVLLAVAFGRQIEEMQALLRWFDAGWEMVSWGAWEQEQLVAQYTCLVNQVVAPQMAVPLKVGLSVNMAVHPEWRGRGLIKHVAQPVYAMLQEMGAVAGVGFSNAEGVKVDQRSKGYGYQVLGRLRPRLLWLSRPQQTAVPVSLTTCWPDGAWQLPHAPTDYFRFAVDPTWLQNRYAGHPFRSYRFGVWQDGETIYGIVIDRPIRWGRVQGSTLLAAYGNDLPGLLVSWGKAVYTTGGRFVHWLATPAAAVTTALQGLGGSVSLPYSRTPYYLTAKPLAETLPTGFLDFQQWDCTGGDIL